MKQLFIVLFTCLLTLTYTFAETTGNIEHLPDSIFSGYHGKHHVQGIVVDKAKGFAYFSFTTSFVKTDLQGNLIGSIEGLTGHLGCLTLNPTDGKVYGSIEYKDDSIGVGISGEDAQNRENAFYIAVIDVDKVTRPDMRPTESKVLTTVYLKDVVDDYLATTMNNDIEVQHRYGCSGIDGVAFGPQPGEPEGKQILYVAYGIYGDISRSDNDYQVLLAYNTEKWNKYAKVLNPGKPHHSGPAKPLCRYFVYTGNTEWGIQNLNYDPSTNAMMAAVYKGKKNEFPNFSLFAIDLDKPAEETFLRVFDEPEIGLLLPLKKMGIYDAASNTYGWRFPHGSTGLCSMGDGLFYISHNESLPEQSTTLFLYRFTGQRRTPFIRINSK